MRLFTKPPIEKANITTIAESEIIDSDMKNPASGIFWIVSKGSTVFTS